MLTDFLKGLFETGKLKVEKEHKDFGDSDKDIAIEILSRYFNQYRYEFPNSSTLTFKKDSGLWALIYLYRLCQALLIRELTEEEIIASLPKYEYGKSRNEILSIDLIFQFVPQIFFISKELSPSDILIEEIKTIAKEWSMSLFEIAEEIDIDYIEKDEMLLAIFCNRIIEKKHSEAIVSEVIKNQILIQLGDHKDHFWKELKEIEYAK